MFSLKRVVALLSYGMLAVTGIFIPLIAATQEVLIAKNNKAIAAIVLPDKPSDVITYSGLELAKYLTKITGASFSINPGGKTNSSIKLQKTNGNNSEAYTISTSKGNIVLAGNSDRAVLFAVYDFLGRLGCVWLAPDLDIFSGKAEIIPNSPNLSFQSPTIREQPAFTYRKLNVDGGRTHNSENLMKMIEWMPKARYNTLMIPANLNNNGRVVWDKWREQLTPEIKKRGLILEVGGHGYQSFLNAKMENGSLFKQHPDWFGKDSTCNPTPSDRLVFNTSNTAAVNYFSNNIVTYLKTHPEIDIFELWPPDVGRWQDCVEMAKHGTARDRQALLANQINTAIKQVRPGLRLEIIAYSYTSSPPAVTLDPDIIVDYCPINQSFEKQIYDGASPNNAGYAAEIKAWRKQFAGTLGVYSYYRKYAWRSEPNVIPHYIQKDMQWYTKIPLHGISTMAEPGDWFTYELNHYTLGHVSWNPNVNVDSLADKFYTGRYAGAANTAKAAYATLENVVPLYGSIPFTSLKPYKETSQAKKKIEEQMNTIQKESVSITDKTVKTNLLRLFMMFQYVHLDLQIQELKVQSKPKDEIIEKIKELVTFIEKNLDKGLFILTGDNDLARFTKKYGLTNQSLLD